jgi:hypothetical protein
MIQCASACSVHGDARRCFDCFQIETARAAESGKDDIEKLIYFADDLLPDRFGRFFSCAVKVCSTGRKRQIFSLTSTNSRLIC